MSVVDEIAGEMSEDETKATSADEAVEVETEAKTGAKDANGEDADDAPKGGTKNVPAGVMLEERRERQRLEKELQTTREKMARMEGLFERLQTDRAAPKEKEPEIIPPYEENPAEHLRGQIAQLTAKLEGITKQSGERKENDERAQAQQAFIGRYRASVSAFAEKQKDFPAAYQHLVAAMHADLAARGYDDPMQREQILQYEEAAMAARAMQAGKDPAKIIYDYAKARGYKQAQDGEDKLDRIEKGAKAAKTLSGTGGRGEGSMTLERLTELADEDPAEFDKQWARMAKAGLL